MPIYDYDHLQGVNWGHRRTKNSNFVHCKNLYNYEDYLWPKFQLNLTLFTKVIAPKPPKWVQLGPEPKKGFFF